MVLFTCWHFMEANIIWLNSFFIIWCTTTHSIRSFTIKTKYVCKFVYKRMWYFTVYSYIVRTQYLIKEKTRFDSVHLKLFIFFRFGSTLSTRLTVAHSILIFSVRHNSIFEKKTKWNFIVRPTNTNWLCRAERY